MKVSVILTSYNHEKYIRQSIDSILNQTFSDFELIIYDDCSQDHTLEILSEYKDERIKVIASDINRGCALLKYVISNYVQGQYIAIAHSDDFWEADKLRRQVEYLDSHEEVSAVFTHVNVVDEDGKRYTDEEGFYYNVFNVENRDRFQWLNHFFYEGNCLCHPSVLIRSEAYEKYELFPVGLRQIPDFYTWIRLCLNSEIHIIEERLTDFRVRNDENNTSGYRKDTSVRSSIEINLILEQFLNIVCYEDFIRVFPETEAYAVKECFVIRYLFARICLNEGTPSYVKAYGFRLLYDVLRDSETAGSVECVYGFGANEFFGLTGRYDVYGLYGSATSETAYLYFDSGNGYSEEQVLSYKYEFWNQRQHVSVTVSDERLTKSSILKLRFDPIENAFVKCKILQFKVNGIEKSIYPVNGCQMDEADTFLDSDPNYEYINDDDETIEKVEVVFWIERLPADALSAGIIREKTQLESRLGKEIDKKIQDAHELKEMLEIREKELEIREKELEIREKELGELHGQVEMMQKELERHKHFFQRFMKKS